MAEATRVVSAILLLSYFLAALMGLFCVSGNHATP